MLHLIKIKRDFCIHTVSNIQPFKKVFNELLVHVYNLSLVIELQISIKYEEEILYKAEYYLQLHSCFYRFSK